ncbi:AI-2E family transporter [Hamadaea tsunoensis]|uniref:AI-2E family transporter n=1 Tax=Hamadaea tsunoensis TaxID=53368 RepID=UPI0004004602|nr:AI-2E family transporter [Hamadaea tsunoensis]
MRFAPDQQRAFRIGVGASAGVLAVVLAAIAVYAVRQTLVLALIALFVAVSLEPAIAGLTRLRIRRGWAVTIVLLGVVLLVGGFIAAVVPTLVHEGSTLGDKLPGYVQEAYEKSKTMRLFGDSKTLAERITTFAQGLPEKVGGSAVGFAGQFFGALSSTLLVIVLAAYFTADLPRLRRGVANLFPDHRREDARKAVDVVVDKVGGYMIGNLIISFIAGTLSLIAFLAIGVPYALPLAVFVAITDLIPLIGATLGAVCCIAVALFTVGLWPGAVLVTAFFILYQQLENYWIAPRVLRGSVELPAVAVLLAGLVGATLLGLVGALMAIPIVAAARVLLMTDWRTPQPATEDPPPAEPA